MLLALVVAAVAIKLIFFSAKDAWFEMDEQSLEHVPDGLVIVRPTHFSGSVYRRGITYDPNDRSPSRVVGRDVSLLDVIAVAYGETPARVILPPGAPTNHFDFIVTATDPRQRLAECIRAKFGYTAQKETRDTGVLALKVVNASLPGLTLSEPGETRKGYYKHGQYYLTHFQLKDLLRDFEDTLKTPVVDETGLTNYYDFALPWNTELIKQLNNGTTARPALNNILAALGLGFEPDTASLEMLIVKKD